MNQTQPQRLKHFHILTAVYVASLFTSLLISARLMPFKIPFTSISILLTGGTWTIPLSFLIQDITTEVYGYQRSRRLIQITLIILSFVVIFLKITTYFPIPSFENIDTSYNMVFDTIPRHLFALLVAIIFGNLFNDYVLSKLKKRLNGKHLAARLIVSTMAGEALLQLSGTISAWVGHMHILSQILPFAVFSYCYKIIFNIVLTPINVAICKTLKQSENIDTYDNDISYNPFSLQMK